ncbi:MAG: S1C family serine protease [Chloroflexota bacterium]
MTDRPDDSSLTDPTHAGRGRRRAIARRMAWFASGIAAAFIALLVFRSIFPAAPPLTSRDVRDSIASALASQTPGPALSETAYRVIQPSLVLIQTDDGTGAATPSHQPGGSLGTGVIIDDAGDILTSLHVVSDATSIKLTFADGSTSAGSIASSHPENDIAVLQAETLPDPLIPATLGNPGSVRVGSEAFVVGNPFGLYASMTTGVISGLDRTFQESPDGPVLHDLIQIDAAVNPGNSGGPLLDRDGRVIGIVAALINPTRQDVFVGIGLAVPIDVAGGAAGLPQY